MPTLAERIESLATDADDHHHLRLLADGVLREAIGYDVAAWASIDPATHLFTSCDVLAGGECLPHDPDRELALFELEFAGIGPNCYLELLDRPSHLAALRATVDDLAEVPRFTQLFEPLGMVDEVRLLLVDGTHTWGALTLYRSAGVFTPDDLALLAPIGPPLARTLRRTFLAAAVARPESVDDPPGFLVLGVDGRVEITSEAAEAWLMRVDEADVAGTLASLAARVRSQPTAHATVSGRDVLVAFHAAKLKGADDMTGVVVERPRPVELASVIVAAYALTRREADVTGAVLSGRSTRQIADALGISQHTVQDHLKKIFTKTGCATRAELTALLYTSHYLPNTLEAATPGPYGWFLDG